MGQAKKHQVKRLEDYVDEEGNFSFRIVIRGKCKEGKKEVYKRRVITVRASSDEHVYEKAEAIFKERNALAGMSDFRYRVIPPWNPNGKNLPIGVKG